MEMNHLILVMAIIGGIVGFAHQILVCHQVWDWTQIHHEGLILACACLAIGIIIGRMR